MAYYYRGLLYILKGDYENARASFKGGLLQDTMAEEAIYQADFALLIFLEGWSSLMLGDWDMAKESFQEVKKFRPDFVIPPRNHNVLLIAETGNAPQKMAVGRGGGALGFIEGQGFREDSVRFITDRSAYAGFSMENIFWQANTPWRTAGGPYPGGQGQFSGYQPGHGANAHAIIFNHPWPCLRILATTRAWWLLSQASSALWVWDSKRFAERTQTQADTRYWDNLPDRVHVVTLNSEDNAHDLKVEFLKPNGRPIAKLDQEADINFVNSRSGFAWVRARSAFDPRTAGPGIKGKGR